MGCGAPCGNSADANPTTRQSQIRLKKIISLITPNGFLYPVKCFANLIKQLQLNLSSFHLSVPTKLQQKSQVKAPIMEKWKAILYGLDFDKSAYVKCLGYPEITKKPEEDKKSIQQIPQQQNGNLGVLQTPKAQVYQHQCFRQIEKDLDRTFNFPQLQKQVFSTVLKKISNHFPVMGYTQGINFIVGYFLIIGYSENDAFWLFTHISLNRKFMFLGLFQDGFPLSSAYVTIFKNVLKRQNTTVYDHIYEKLCVDESLWIFKWFITSFIYSFPFEMCQYVIDLVITIGGMGMITFAIGLVKNLQKYILEAEDPCELSSFLEELKDIQGFNRYVNLKQVMAVAYYIQITEEDLEGLENLKKPDGSISFYAQYLKAYFEDEKRKKNLHLNSQKLQKKDSFMSTNPTILKKVASEVESSKLIQNWYQKLFYERKQFKKQFLKKKRKQLILEKPKQILLLLKGKDEDSVRKSKKVEKFQFEDQADNQLNNSNQKIKTNPNQDKSSNKKSRGSKVKRDFFNSDDQQQKREKDDKMDEDSLYYFSKNINLKKNRQTLDVQSQRPISNRMQINIKPHDLQTKTQKGLRPHFLTAGKSIVNSMSISNASNRSSISSKKTIQKENNSGRECNCYREDSLDRQSFQSRKSSQKNSQHTITQIHYLKPVDKNEKKKRGWMLQSPAEKQFDLIEGDRMFKKKRRHQTGENMLKIKNISELQEKMPSIERSQAVFGQSSYDSMFVANFSSQQNSRMSQIESIK